MKRTINVLIALALVASLGLVVAAPVVASGPVENIDTSETFSTIQAAINDADTDNGDTIEVGSGTYNENVSVNKELTIQAASSAAPVIDAGGGLGFDIWSDNVTISGLTIENAGIGISIPGKTDVHIVDNSIENCSNSGIVLFSADGNTIENNNFSSNVWWDIYLQGSDDNTIKDNTLSSSAVGGIRLDGGSSSNEISGNTIDGSSTGIVFSYAGTDNIVEDNEIAATGWAGIDIQASGDNTSVTDNTIQSTGLINIFVVSSDIHIVGNTILDGSFGIHFTDSTSIVNYNNFAGNNVGIFVGSGDIDIEGNTISDGGECGILFQAGEGNVYYNNISGNDNGILFTAAASGTVKFNNIADNNIVGIYSETDDVTINFNNITGNNVGLDNHTYNTIDATKNWWGHASGPSGPNGRVNNKGGVIGKGDSIVGLTDGNVDWDPWLPQPVGHTKHEPVPPGLE